jgi:hypothetical protein
MPVTLFNHGKRNLNTLKGTTMEQLFIDLNTKLEEIKTQMAADLLVKFNEGFAAGVASVGTGGVKIYSQEEADAIVKDNMDKLKQSLKEAYINQQVAETAGEVGFSDLLS